jgi:hypothetical protein
VSDPPPPPLDRLDLAAEPATPAEAAAQAPYRRMIARLRELPPLEPPAGWEDRAVVRLRAARAAERRRVIVGVGVAALAAAAVVLLLLRPTDAPAPRGLQVAVAAPEGVVRRGPAAIGDRLRAQVPWSAGEVELRVYRGDRLVARCPSAEARATCQRVGRHRELELVLELREAGIYRIVALSAAGPLPAPGDDGLDVDLLRARSAGATVERGDAVHVR